MPLWWQYGFLPCLLNLHLHYGITMCKEIRKNRLISVVLPALAVYVAAYGFQYVSGVLTLFLDYYAYVAVLLMVVGPALLLIGRKTTGSEGIGDE